MTRPIVGMGTPFRSSLPTLVATLSSRALTGVKQFFSTHLPTLNFLPTALNLGPLNRSLTCRAAQLCPAHRNREHRKILSDSYTRLWVVMELSDRWIMMAELNRPHLPSPLHRDLHLALLPLSTGTPSPLGWVLRSPYRRRATLDFPYRLSRLP